MHYLYGGNLIDKTGEDQMSWTKLITFDIRESGDVWICEDCQEEYEMALDAVQCECEDDKNE